MGGCCSNTWGGRRKPQSVVPRLPVQYYRTTLLHPHPTPDTPMTRANAPKKLRIPFPTLSPTNYISVYTHTPDSSFPRIPSKTTHPPLHHFRMLRAESAAKQAPKRIAWATQESAVCRCGVLSLIAGAQRCRPSVCGCACVPPRRTWGLAFCLEWAGFALLNTVLQ